MASIGELKTNFKKLLQQNRLAHGYMLFGHESAEEKFLFSKELAHFLETKKWEIGNRFLIDAKIVDAREEAGIDLVRLAGQFLWQKPAASDKRILVINFADNLTLPAQNAILKISEEPPAHALIMLLTKNHEVFLPALQSRFQKIYVSRHKFSESKEGGIPPKAGHANSQDQILKFLKAGAAQRKEIIREIVEEATRLEDFVAGLIAELRKDIIKNWPVLKELLYRWTVINQFNTNKRLQLEAALLELK